MSNKDKREICFFCGKEKPGVLTLRDKDGDHPVCPDCGEKWLKSDEPWPQRQHKKKPLPLCS